MNINKGERPIGVSGLMRVKDEEEYVEASINSVIDALDELIICYQECSDGTTAIIEHKQKEYPGKIKVYFYAPKVYAHNLTPDELAYACSLPDDSPHLLSSYYNYALSKATYRYAVKIDADQVYFSERMQQICEAYRSEKQVKRSMLERVVEKCICYGTLNYKNKLKIGIQKSLSVFFDLDSLYKQSVLKRIANEKCLTWVSGINLYKEEGDSYYISLGDMHPYNGTYDHCFFEITDETYYYPGKQFLQLFPNSLIETFHLDPESKSTSYGFLWYHLRACKKLNRIKGLKGIEHHLFKQFTTKELCAKGWLLQPDCFRFFHFYFAFLQDYDTSYPPLKK